VSVEQGYAAARVCAINALAAAQSLLGSLEQVRLVRTVGYVAGTPDFTSQPAVVNGASELLRDIFGEERGIAARLALGVASLPLGAAVEVELLLEVS
jgi:enamine deaminase RidA (YjgF/YER057c/UK114 family)